MNEYTKDQLEEMFGDDRIDQLAFLAGCTNHSFSDPRDPGLNGYIIHGDRLRNFAELIIQECLGLCKDAENAFLLHGMQEREAHGAISVQEYIKEHFGMK